jgi:hypothetical protein
MKYPNLLHKPFTIGIRLSAVIVFCIFLAKTIFGQTFTLTKDVSSELNFYSEDALGNKYFLTHGELIKKEISGEQSSYTNRQFGADMYVDVSDPLNILVFFKDFGHTVFLDKNLSVKNSFSFRQLQINLQPTMVCSSSKNGFWAWYSDLFQLVRFDNSIIQQAKSDDMSMQQYIPGIVTFMLENNDKLFMATDKGIWVFDQHANYLFSIPGIKVDFFQVNGQKIIYRKANNLHVYDFFLDQENVFLLPETHIEHFFLTNNKTIYIQTRESLRKYSFSGRFF